MTSLPGISDLLAASVRGDSASSTESISRAYLRLPPIPDVRQDADISPPFPRHLAFVINQPHDVQEPISSQSRLNSSTVHLYGPPGHLQRSPYTAVRADPATDCQLVSSSVDGADISNASLFMFRLSPMDDLKIRHECPYCHRIFDRPSTLRVHVYTHTGETPYECPIQSCGRKFNVKSNMQRHLRGHNNPQQKPGA